MRIYKILIVLMSMLILNPAFAVDWSTYRNTEFGFKVDFPLYIFTHQSQAETGNGIIKKTEDESAEFRAYAFENEEKLPLKTILKIIVDESDGREITYRRIKKNWIVISGYEWENDRRLVFYQRLAASRDGHKFSVFELIYPEDQRATFDSMIKRMSLSLTAPAS